ncbi:MAG: hypothetical protein CVU56_29705 [Deltaproteobacteria bacterium HGW-Deltaproteobacteria-14]|jgi:MYXO-CTERM domain-containing protein|nr:MAG: hypothetical protein CVU56_29705 [Deltaproteobacteria bacterium HGW-Deltaproteobacteria-14]
MDETEARLRRELSRVPEDDLAPGDLADLFSRVAAETVDRPPTLRDRLRELSTPVRIALAVGGALIMVTVALLIVGIRTDLTGQAMARYAVAMAAIAGLMGAAFAASLRGAHQRPLRWWTWVLVVTALLVPLALAVMPWLWEGDGVIRPSGHAHPFGMCGVMGLVTGALTAAVAWAFQRESWSVTSRLVAAVAGGGLTAFAMLQLHCPSGDATHLLIGHSSAGLMLAAVAVGATLWRRRR